MMRYKLMVRKPRISRWICASRRFKFILVSVVLGLSIAMLVHIAERNTTLSSIYNLQASIGQVLDLELKYLPKVNETDGWKGTSVYRAQIFSAYLDTRPEEILEQTDAITANEKTWAMIRIIAILDIEMTDAPLNCVYKFSDGDSYVLTNRKASMVKPIALPENFDLQYSAFFILCDLTIPSDSSNDDIRANRHLPNEITIAPIDQIVFDQLEKDSFIPVHYSKNNITMSEYSNRFMAVCVQMFHHNYDKVNDLIEFIEFYKMMGAGHFTFYNRSMSSRVSHVLHHYRNQGIATILPWELPPYFKFEKNIRVDGIFAALNDCMYRSSFYESFMYVAGVDVDELIVPRKHQDYPSMMHYLDPLGPDKPPNIQAAFLFRNRFFYSMFEDDPVTLPPGTPRLSTHSKTLRWEETNEAGHRSKFIVRSRDTVELGNHRTWKMRRTSSALGHRYEEVAVDVDVGTSHHYRTCETHADKCWRRTMIRDRVAHKFTSELSERVAAACKDIFENGCPVGKKNKLP